MAEIREKLASAPVTAILGPRQSGKTTLARMLAADHYFDLENPRDSARLSQPQTALEALTGTVVIDEVQRMPELFPLLRYLADTQPKTRYLVLGSASPDLVSQASESLAGRIAFHDLGPFAIDEVGPQRTRTLWVRGGFPRSLLARDDRESVRWREDFVRAFLERDIPQLGISIPS
ncbi:MAG: AAA family ATPase, partial [Spirochaetales bacterium]|nr:AAA family ATPase [Spirochaetales bacterium]